ncbi:hypothetical protein ON010_g14429 [Phytophthora cinnamomi]|nr:hypothetical protein ON010_g14429 [Phytophthora cinnamomi]
MNGHGCDIRAGTGQQIADVALPPQTKRPDPPILLLSQSNGGCVQQDNAPANISVDNSQLADAVQQQELDIELCCQPPNSPDLNCFDLGLFAAIQARQRLRTPRSFDEVIDAVTAA